MFCRGCGIALCHFEKRASNLACSNRVDYFTPKGNKMFSLKTCAKECLPPVILRAIRSFHGGGIRFEGSYATWEEAASVCSGYDAEHILAKVLDAMLKVKRGEAVYERDSVLFDEIEYSWPVLAGLMWVAAQNAGRLNVLDFGGSLGSTYYQNKKFLDTLHEVHWSIVEQNHFVQAGKTNFEDERLTFWSDIDDCVKALSPNTLLLSSVIQYLKDPYLLLQKVKSSNFEYIIFDRTPFVLDDNDILTVQKVPREIYAASYPCWFFGKQRFYAFFEDEYTVVAKFPSLDKANRPSTFEGCIFRKK